MLNFVWNTWKYWWNETDDEIMPVFARVLWILKLIFSCFHGKLLLVLLQAISHVFSCKKMLKWYLRLFWYIYLCWCTYNKREFKEPRQRRRGQRRFNNESRGTLGRVWKISRCGSRSLDNPEFGHFTLFCRGRQRDFTRIISRAQPLFCSLNLLFSVVPVFVAVVVFE